MREARSVSVVIPTFNECELIAQQLEALCAQRLDIPTEIVIADNGSTDATLEVVGAFAKSDPRVRIVDASQSPGPKHARQRGSQLAKGELLLYCDADDVVAEGWLSAMVAAAATSDAVGGQLEHALVNPVSVRRWRAGSPMTELPTSLRFLPYAASANFGVWRDALERVGGWEIGTTYGEDVDLSWRLQLAGYQLTYCHEAIVHYRHRTTPRDLWKQCVKYGQGETELLNRFREYGARPATFSLALWRIWYMLSRMPYLVWGEARRGLWISVAAPTWGRFLGSIRHRVFRP